MVYETVDPEKFDQDEERCRVEMDGVWSCPAQILHTAPARQDSRYMAGDMIRRQSS
jgi:hypothetical protein